MVCLFSFKEGAGDLEPLAKDLGMVTIPLSLSKATRSEKVVKAPSTPFFPAVYGVVMAEDEPIPRAFELIHGS